jgi:hypothetical protein
LKGPVASSVIIPKQRQVVAVAKSAGLSPLTAVGADETICGHLYVRRSNDAQQGRSCSHDRPAFCDREFEPMSVVMKFGGASVADVTPSKMLRGLSNAILQSVRASGSGRLGNERRNKPVARKFRFNNSSPIMVKCRRIVSVINALTELLDLPWLSRFLTDLESNKDNPEHGPCAETPTCKRSSTMKCFHSVKDCRAIFSRGYFAGRKSTPRTLMLASALLLMISTPSRRH